MKFLTEKTITQKIILAVVFVILFNFISPNLSLAASAEATAGGILFEPIKDLLLVVADGIITLVQSILFGMDVSFVTIRYDKDWIPQIVGTLVGVIGGAAAIAIGLAGAPFSGGLSLAAVAAGIKLVVVTATVSIGTGLAATYLSSKALPEKLKLPMFSLSPEEIFKNKIALLDVNFFNPNKYEDTTTVDGQTVEQKSSALTLQPIVSTWYYALRNLAIVALLSILVYVGIRILISSSAEDKAKYKQRLLDWLVAMCLLFFMHYIMAFAVTITEEITKAIVPMNDEYGIIIGSSGGPVGNEGDGDSRDLNEYEFDDGSKVFSGDSGSISEAMMNAGVIIDDTDSGNKLLVWPSNMMGKARIELQLEPQSMSDDEILMRQFGYTVIYLALVVYTVLFLFRYLKRLMMLTFLTIIAPLMAMTYPLDKIKDGSAQGFNTWLKEYIYNLLIQPVHLVIYTVLMGTALDLVMDNLIYGLVALGFILQAEKLLRKFFGFDKASTVAGGSALGGALAMQGINTLGKMLGRGGKNQKGGKEDSKKLPSSNRTADKNKNSDDLFGDNGGGALESGSNNGSNNNPNGGPDGGPDLSSRNGGNNEENTPPEPPPNADDIQRRMLEADIENGEIDNAQRETLERAQNQQNSQSSMTPEEYAQSLRNAGFDEDEIFDMVGEQYPDETGYNQGLGSYWANKARNAYDGSGLQRKARAIGGFARNVGNGVMKPVHAVGGAVGSAKDAVAGGIDRTAGRIRESAYNAYRDHTTPELRRAVHNTGRNLSKHAQTAKGYVAKGARSLGNGIAYVAPRAGKALGKAAIKGTLMGAGAVAGVTAGLVSDDFSNVVKWGGAGAGAGLAAVTGVTRSLEGTQGISSRIDSAIEAQYAATHTEDEIEARQNAQADARFLRDREKRKYYQDKLGVSAKEAQKIMRTDAMKYREYGITDDKIITKAMKADGFGQGRASEEKLLLASLASDVESKRDLKITRESLERRGFSKENTEKYVDGIRKIKKWTVS